MSRDATVEEVNAEIQRQLAEHLADTAVSMGLPRGATEEQVDAAMRQQFLDYLGDDVDPGLCPQRLYRGPGPRRRVSSTSRS